MTVVRPRLLQLLRDTIVLAVVSAKVTINNEVRTYAIFRHEIIDEKVLLYIYIPDIDGEITEAVLVDNVGAELAGDTMYVKKGEEGFMIAFEFTLTLGVN